MNDKPLIVHVLYRLDTGGMELMLITLINQTHKYYRHAVVCLDGYTAVRDRIEFDDVPCFALNKKSGKDWLCYFRLWRILRKLKPDLVHTYNLGALDAAPIAKLAGARRVVHAERGRDARDPQGESRKYRRLRRALLPFIDRYLAVSRDLQHWLVEKIGIDAARVACIPNGIDLDKFAAAPGKGEGRVLLGSFAPPGTILIGTVGRLDPVKDHAGLISAFNYLCEWLPGLREHLRLVIVGAGPTHAVLDAQINRLGLCAQVCLLGNRSDIPALLGEFDIFALSSIAEGMPGVVLEAMAAGLPVVATDVGGVSEVVQSGVTGMLVAAGSADGLAKALEAYACNSALRGQHGRSGRMRVEAWFSLGRMISAYIAFYDRLLNRREPAACSDAASELLGHKEK
ncbi:TIGR03088 family PEP-CTERM/XrtA system glycosyltransferase [Rhodanobacter lindaniclasticus]